MILAQSEPLWLNHITGHILGCSKAQALTGAFSLTSLYELGPRQVSVLNWLGQDSYETTQDYDSVSE